MSTADLSLAVTLAQQAGDILLRHWQTRDSLTISTKRAGDFMSRADLDAETFLRDALRTARPSDGWLGEETGADGSSERVWIVDPLDGTTNFLRGIPHWAVSIALREAGQLTVGVIHDPIKSETFAARCGAPATLNGQPIRTAPTTTLEPALFGTGIPFGGMAHIDDHAADIARLMPLCAGVRRMGAASLDLAYVAAGRLDGFWERRLQPWDIAAGLVILQQSGARTEGWHSTENPQDSGTVITAAPSLFDAFARVLRTG